MVFFQRKHKWPNRLSFWNSQLASAANLIKYSLNMLAWLHWLGNYHKRTNDLAIYVFFERRPKYQKSETSPSRGIWIDATQCDLCCKKFIQNGHNSSQKQTSSPLNSCLFLYIFVVTRSTMFGQMIKSWPVWESFIDLDSMDSVVLGRPKTSKVSKYWVCAVKLKKIPVVIVALELWVPQS